MAHSSVSHLGYCYVGPFRFFPSGVAGRHVSDDKPRAFNGRAVPIVGMLYERRHTRLMSEFGGLAKTVPLLAVVFMITMLSSAGLPGLNGFMGELLIPLAAFSASPLYAAFAATGVILGRFIYSIYIRR